MKFYTKNRFTKLSLLIFYLFIIGTLCSAQTIGDFQSASTGEWTTLTTWQTYTTTGWVAAANYPGQNAGNYAVTIQAGNAVSIPNAGITTNSMGTLTISGTLILNGSNSIPVFYLNTALIRVTPNLTPSATIDFSGKCILKLPPDAVIEVKTGGLSGSANNNQEIHIGIYKFAVGNGGVGVVFTFAELMAAGGTLNAIAYVPPRKCLGDLIQLKGSYSGAIGDPVTYSWTSIGPAPLDFNPNPAAPEPTVVPTVAGSYTLSLTVSTKKGIELYNNTEKTTLIVVPTSSVNNKTICSAELNYTWSGLTFTKAETQTKTGLKNVLNCDSTAIFNLTVNPTPTVTNTPLTQTICSGTSTTLVTLTSNDASTTFVWTATKDALITGLTTSSGTNIIPPETLTNTSNSTAGTVTYIITPTANGCTGIAVNYVVTVNPKPIISNIYHQ